MASNLEAMASNLLAMASNLIAIASNQTSLIEHPAKEPEVHSFTSLWQSPRAPVPLAAVSALHLGLRLKILEMQEINMIEVIKELLHVKLNKKSKQTLSLVLNSIEAQ